MPLPAILPALKALSLGQRLAGAAILLALWLLPPAAVWFYMRGQLAAQFDLGQAKASEQCARDQVGAIAQAIKDAKAEWDKAQASIDKQAAKTAQAIANDLKKERQKASHLEKELARHAKANPLPAGCRADPDRVRLFNEARGGNAPEA